MHSRSQIVIVVLFLLVASSYGFFWPKNGKGPIQDVGGGLGCASCTIVTSLLEQLALIHNKTVENVVDTICDWLLPPEFASTCEYFVNAYGAEVIRLFDQGFNADEVCHGIAFCTLPQCGLWTPSGKGHPVPSPQFVQKRHISQNPWDWILKLLEPVIDHRPEIDFDGDRFSTISELRGANWRGKDCDDGSNKIYPGRKVSSFPATTDHNCNGVYMKNGIDYEQKFCSNSGQTGIILVGDSAGAHFSIPPDYMNASAINDQTYSNLLGVISDEVDWPHRSGTTGYVPSTADYTVHSLYLHMRERNLCNHRDYQNICLNGLRSGSAIEMAQTMSRNQTLDNPVLLVLELIGNDVCSGHPDFNHYTPPADFEKSILTILDNLNSTLPAGSHVMFIGLAQGGVLYDTLHARTHPIGATYEQVYDYLNCLQISPCWTWMNSNATVRNMGNAWAAKLSSIYSEIIQTNTYKNFDMAYYPFPLDDVLQMWLKMGGQGLWQLIEPIDGFHPNQIENWLAGDWYLQTLLRDHPDWLGAVNPNNDQIQQMFGDQGGY